MKSTKFLILMLAVLLAGYSCQGPDPVLNGDITVTAQPEEDMEGNVWICMAGTTDSVTINWGDRTPIEKHKLYAAADYWELFGTYGNIYRYRHKYSNTSKHTIKITGGVTRLVIESAIIKNLDVSKKTELKDLDCSYNQLKNLNVCKNTELTGLYCNHNELTNLDVSNNTMLCHLRCNNNKLTSLDVSNCVICLNWIDISSNQLSAGALNNLFETLNNNLGFKKINIANNPGTSSCDISIATSKGWEVIR